MNRKAQAELMKMLDRSGYDLSPCSFCGEPLVTVPDGMPSMCIECRIKFEEYTRTPNTLAMGVDPGTGETGYAIIDQAQRNILEIRTLYKLSPELYARHLLLAARKHGVRRVAVQVPVAQNGKTPYFRHKRGADGEPARPVSPVSVMKNHGLSMYLAGFLTGQGLTVTHFDSTQCKNRGFKQSEHIWRLYWGYDGHTSEHARDAAQIAREAKQERGNDDAML